MKKIFLSIGAFSALVAPVATVVACGSDGDNNNNSNDDQTNNGLPFKLVYAWTNVNKELGTGTPISNEEIKEKGLTRLGDSIWYQVGDASGAKSNWPNYDRHSLGGQYYANIGDLTVTEADELLKKWLKSIDDWYWEDTGSTWSITSNKINLSLSGDYQNRDFTEKPYVIFD